MGARDQGSRPTCLAFAISDGHAASRGIQQPLSTDYLHYYAAKRQGIGVNGAVNTPRVQEALEHDGQPSEAMCSYADPRHDSWTPPTGLTPVWTRPSKICTGIPSVVLREALLSSRANVLTLRISNSFYTPDPTSHTVVEDGSTDVVRHAVLVVGLRSTKSGDQYFLARNSWGADWGTDGHAWLPSTYVDARAIGVIEFVV